MTASIYETGGSKTETAYRTQKATSDFNLSQKADPKEKPPQRKTLGILFY